MGVICQNKTILSVYDSANDYVDKEYKFLQHWCKRWANDTWGDLLTHFYLHIEDDWVKFNKIPDCEKHKWVQSWLRNTSNWINNPYSKDTRVNNLPEYYELPDKGSNEYIEIFAEDCDDSTKEYIADLHRNFSDRQVDLLLKVRLVYVSKLTVRERVLYDLIYKDGMSYRAISAKLRIPTTVVFQAVKNLNKKIEELCILN